VVAVIAGIDEAGYGPTLGPLVVTGVAFRVPDESTDACLWRTLSRSITRQPSQGRRRLPIADSKKIYSPAAGLRALERSVLSALHAFGVSPTGMRALIGLAAGHCLGELSAYPWYRDFDLPIPSESTADDVRTRANALRLDAAAQGVQLVGVFCEPVLEGRFNELVGRTRNKATVLLNATLRIVHRVMAAAGREQLSVHIDRQGGRIDYMQHVIVALAPDDLHIVEHSEDRSAYAFRRGGRQCALDFLVNGEDRHMPVALASMISKYLRELLMRGFNSYWRGHVRDLRPTAGYYNDAQRFLADIDGAVRRLNVDRAALVRCR